MKAEILSFGDTGKSKVIETWTLRGEVAVCSAQDSPSRSWRLGVDMGAVLDRRSVRPMADVSDDLGEVRSQQAQNQPRADRSGKGEQQPAKGALMTTGGERPA